MYQLFIANKNYSSWSMRPWVLMRALNIPFEETLVRFEGVSNWDRYREFAPNGRVPCLKDDDRIVWDSLGITEYLAEAHPNVWPSDKSARAWARSATAEMHSGFADLRDICGMNCGVRVRLHEISSHLQHDIDRIDEMWREGIGRFGGPHLAGHDFSAVDAFYAPVVARVQTYRLALSDESKKYSERILSHPAFQEWYDAALKETFRDAGHEADLTKFGTVIEDLRAPAD